jgi:hypothetical protein
MFVCRCWSYVGRAGGEQKISIGPGCEFVGTVIHEIGHAVGFWHEQSRRDRDDYIKIIEENIEPSAVAQFSKYNNWPHVSSVCLEERKHILTGPAKIQHKQPVGNIRDKKTRFLCCTLQTEKQEHIITHEFRCYF